MNGILTGFFGAIVEAWAQLRIGKLRVLLSLVRMPFMRLLRDWRGRSGRGRSEE